MADERIKPSVTHDKHAVLPHYLRASTRSCHDMCKYGRKDAFHEKTTKPPRKRTVKPSSPEYIPVDLAVSGKPKEKLVKPKPATDVKKHSLDLKCSPDIKSCPLKHKPLPAKSYTLKVDAPSVDKNILLKCKPSSSVKKPLSRDPPEIIKREILQQCRKVEIPLSKGSVTGEQSRSAKRVDHPSEKQFSAKSKPLKLVLTVSGNSDHLDGMRKKNSDAKSSRKAVASAPASFGLEENRNEKVLVRTRKAGSLKLVSCKEKPCIVGSNTSYSNDNVSEKTLHVIKMEAKDKSMETDPSFPSPASPKSFLRINSPSLSSHEKSNEGSDDRDNNTDEFGSFNEEIPTEHVKEDHTKTLMKNRVIVSEDEYGSPVKLKFRSGKVVDLQPASNNPRRLEFRKARVAGAGNGEADQNVKTLKKSRGKDDAAGAMISTEKVILKHQDVKGKKDSQSLFNNVIEATARKLVESRKSKVKALVGAFETVISLQENKPSSNSVRRSGK